MSNTPETIYANRIRIFLITNHNVQGIILYICTYLSLQKGSPLGRVFQAQSKSLITASDEHRVRNAPSTIRYSSSNPVIPSRTSPRKTPRQSNCVEQKILYPLRFTEKRAKNAQQAANKKDYWKYQVRKDVALIFINYKEKTRKLNRKAEPLSFAR